MKKNWHFSTYFCWRHYFWRLICVPYMVESIRAKFQVYFWRNCGGGGIMGEPPKGPSWIGLITFYPRFNFKSLIMKNCILQVGYAEDKIEKTPQIFALDVTLVTMETIAYWISELLLLGGALYFPTFRHWNLEMAASLYPSTPVLRWE